VTGVTNVSLDYLKKLLHVTYDSHLDPQIIYQIALCIENAGYSVEWGKGDRYHIKYYKIDGMYCNHCIGTVERAIQPIHGVKHVIVNLDKHNATVIVDPSFQSEELIEAISSVGYDATPYEGNRDIYLRIEGMVTTSLFIALINSKLTNLLSRHVRNFVPMHFTMLYGKLMVWLVSKLILVKDKQLFVEVQSLKIWLLQLSKQDLLPSQ
jgi:copper chaperone